MPRSTLADWCRDIELTDEQCVAIVERTGSRKGVPRDTQRKRRLEVEAIRASAIEEVPKLARQTLWLAGTVMYWAEGSKTMRALVLANTDPAVLRLFVSWCRTYHDPTAEFRLSLHLHEGNDETKARGHWRSLLDLREAQFTKTYIKPAGTGHRKNRHEHGVCRVVMCRSTDAFYRTLAWIDRLAGELSPDGLLAPTANLSVGR